MKFFESLKQFLIKFNEIEPISNELMLLIRPYFNKKKNGKNGKNMIFFKRSGEFLFKYHDIEAFSKQLMPLIRTS